jgi:uncharacterized membrane protein
MDDVNPTSTVLLAITATLTGLFAGLLYAWACSVTPGLAALSDTEYITAFRSMNRAIQNPVFFASFVGAALLLPVCTWSSAGPSLTSRFWCLLAATVLYWIGGIGITAFGNIPLNNALEAFHPQGATAQDLAAMRFRFETPWNRLHTLRTWATVLSFILVIGACLSKGK